METTGIPEVDAILNKLPEERIAQPSGDPLYDRMCGILIGFAFMLQARGQSLDSDTVARAVREMEEMIAQQGGVLGKRH